MKRSVFLFILLVLMSGCVSAKNYAANRGGVGYYTVGSSYVVKGKTYHPKIYSHYKETGVASWYGIECQNQLTANGERFDRNSVSAAHKTLPLPSVVKVTNLENGKSLNIKVNDRGPFANDRIIDLSEKAAKILGFHRQGVAKVKVEYLQGLSKQLIEKHPSYKKHYDKVTENYRLTSISQRGTDGYSANFSSAKKSKETAVALRRQGVKGVRIYQQKGQYHVKVGK